MVFVTRLGHSITAKVNSEIVAYGIINDVNEVTLHGVTKFHELKGKTFENTDEFKKFIKSRKLI